MVALAWHDGALLAAMNSRDQLDTLWPDQFAASRNAERPSEMSDAGEGRIELRLAVLLSTITLQNKFVSRARVRRRRQEDDALRAGHAAGGGVSRRIGRRST